MPFTGCPEARASVQGNRSWALNWRPQSEMAKAAFARPAEHLLEQGTSYAAPTPCGFDPHAADPTDVGMRPVHEAVCRAHDALRFAPEEHHMRAGYRDRAGELFPVRDVPHGRLGKALGKGIRGVAQSAPADISVQLHLV
jgi:hypothetical protein